MGYKRSLTGDQEVREWQGLEGGSRDGEGGEGAASVGSPADESGPSRQGAA